MKFPRSKRKAKKIPMRTLLGMAAGAGVGALMVDFLYKSSDRHMEEVEDEVREGMRRNPDG